MDTEYDGYAPIHTCTCGCGLVIGDGDWASNRRSHTQLIPRQRRYGAAHLTSTVAAPSTRR